ncbi:hypothetical protein GR254_19655, partial [Mycobacterium tuberculosis]|nr:hypothetical protein [Mycobacterium tuberculosis]
ARAAADLVPTATLLDTYSPELFCMIRNFHDAAPRTRKPRATWWRCVLPAHRSPCLLWSLPHTPLRSLLTSGWVWACVTESVCYVECRR